MQRIFDPIKSDILCQYSTQVNPFPHYHRHDACEIYVFLNGDADYYIEQSCYHLTRGNILVMRPGEYHRVALRDHHIYERISINIKRRIFDTFSTGQSDLSACFFDRPSGEQNLGKMNEQELKEFIVLSNQLQGSLNQPGYGKDLLSISYLLQILIRTNLLFRHRPDTENSNIMSPLIRGVMDYVDGHLLEDITLEKLSSLFFHNGTYISRCCKKATGLTISQYVILKRISLAQEYLEKGHSVTDSCMLSGFNNYSNFSRTFTKQVGCSPKQYQAGSHGCHK